MDNLNEILNNMGKLRNCTTKDNDYHYIHATYNEKECVCGLNSDYTYPVGSTITSIDCKDCMEILIGWIETISNAGPEWEQLVSKAFEIAYINSKILGN